MRCTACILILLLAFSCKKDRLQWPAPPEQLASGTTDRLNDILVLSESVLLVAGGERFTSTTMLHSTDGGTTWNVQAFPQIGKGMYALAAATGGSVLAAGFEAKGLKTSDSGRTWEVISFPRSEPYTGVAFESNGRGWLVGGISFKQGARQQIDASGAGPSADSVAYQLNDVVVTAEGAVFIAGYGIVLRLASGSTSWETMDVQGDNFTALFAASWGDLYACGSEGSIVVSEDSGINWKKLRAQQALGGPHYHLHDLLFTDAQHGYCVGENGIVICTDDGGEHWAEYATFTSAHLRSIAALPGGDLLVCGDGGALWRLKVR